MDVQAGPFHLFCHPGSRFDIRIAKGHPVSFAFFIDTELGKVKDRTLQAILIHAVSTLRYSAIPPATPPTIRSDRLRVIRRCSDGTWVRNSLLG